MRFVLSLVPLAGLAVVGHGSPGKPEPARPAVPVVKNAIVLLHFGGGTSANAKVALEAPAPVSFLEMGLPYAQKASSRPILAMSESKDWFF